MTSDIQGLHHAAYRCKNSAQTRAFYEDFLELPLVEAFPISTTATGRQTQVLHTFFQMADGSCLAFFEAPGQAFEFKTQHDFDLHIALRVDYTTLERMLKKGRQEGFEVRGPSDHGFIHSIYFRDPNGYVVELAAPVPGEAKTSGFDPATARKRLASWQAQAHG
jgi:catechol 2,3-dioxygenase-like lactoylglutathione lyase family enzyme